MENNLDTYKTVIKPSEEVLFKDRKSKFFGYVFPIANEESIKPLLKSLRKKHSNANHVCYAWRLGVEKIRYRINDDGEPNNSAGQPIYNQVLAYGVTNMLVAVVRIFGGAKLGVSGLINAYRTAAKMALDSAEIIEKTQQVNFELVFDYPEMNQVMRIIKQQKLQIISQKLNTACKILVAIRKREAQNLASILSAVPNLKFRTNDL